MTSGQRQSVLRIDRDRRSLHAVAFRRLTKARRAGAFADALYRPAMLAYAAGMERAARDASRALQFDVRTAHHELSIADDRQDDEEIRRKIAWLGLGSDAVERVRDDALRIAGRVGEELRRVANKSETVSDLSHETHLAVASAGGNVSNLLTPSADVFGTFGRANVSDALLDTWAETVAYSQYERGRDDAVKQYPAYAEALWGYRFNATLDNRTTVTCKTLSDWVAPVGDTRMDALKPPLHFRCRSMLTPVYQATGLKTPVAVNTPSDATFARLLARKEDFVRRLA